MIPEFKDGPEGLRNKANAVVRAINALESIRGDGVFIKVDRQTNGLVVALNWNQVLARLPKRPSAGATSDSFLGQITSVSGSFPAWTYTIMRVVGFDSSKTDKTKWVVDSSSSAVAVSAVNRMEFGWTGSFSSYRYGTGDLITSNTGQVNSTACVIHPIGVGATVQVDVDTDLNPASAFYGLPVYSFAAENGVE
jgi:hypothetical protein